MSGLDGSEQLEGLEGPPDQTHHAVEPPVRLQLHHSICSGSEGAVELATYGGRPAVAKLLGPDSSGLAAWRAEVAMYGRLEALQGVLVPELLDACHLELGVHFVAMGLVDGKPLSSLATVPDDVAASALHCLRSLQAHVPGFLHGDIRLPNILWLDRSGSGGAPPACMFLDFGRSSSNGTAAQQADEECVLRCLLGLP